MNRPQSAQRWSTALWHRSPTLPARCIQVSPSMIPVSCQQLLPRMGGEVSCFGLANAWKHRNSKLQTSQRLTCGLSSATDGSNNNEDDDSCSQQLARAETAKTANTSESIRKLVCGETNYRDPPWRCAYILTVKLASPRLVSVQRHVATAPFLLPTCDGSRRGRLPFE